MKRLISLIVAIVFIAVPVFGEIMEDDIKANPMGEPATHCPKTLIGDADKCFQCHTVPSFKLKEAEVGEGRLIQSYFASENGKAYLKYNLGDVDRYAWGELKRIRNYIESHPGIVDRLVVNILSPGGSLFHAWAIVGLFDEFKNMGVRVETRCSGFAASAAFLIFASGHDRVTSPNAEYMWHELRSWVFLDEKNPSKLEDEARIFRHLQNTANKHLASVSKVTKTFLDKSIDKDELWLTGREMLKHGFADRLIK
jgi:ATP-dependent protease ClpP protease subunit